MYRIVVQLFEPYTLLLLGLLMSCCWAWRCDKSRRSAQILTSSLLGLLLFLSTPLAGFLALRSLEGFCPPTDAVPGSKDTIVVLSGCIRRDDSEHVRVGPDTFYRCYHAVELYKKAGHCRLLLSGGKTDFSEPGPTLADVMWGFVIELGVEPSDILLEEQSSTTLQNAAFSAALLSNGNEGRTFLVTDTAHMRRATYCFQSQGIPIIPSPCNYGARRLELSLVSLLPSADGIHAVNDAAHEWLGLIWYQLRSYGRA